MRAVICREFGPPEQLTVEELNTPEPSEGEVRVEPRGLGVNFVDVLMVAGGYQLRPDLPFVPGLEAAGVVSAVGANAGTVREGDRVMVGMRPGAFAEPFVWLRTKSFPCLTSSRWNKAPASGQHSIRPTTDWCKAAAFKLAKSRLFMGQRWYGPRVPSRWLNVSAQR